MSENSFVEQFIIWLLAGGFTYVSLRGWNKEQSYMDNKIKFELQECERLRKEYTKGKND